MRRLYRLIRRAIAWRSISSAWWVLEYEAAKTAKEEMQ